ncbi:MAG: 4-alpha-glucanotransferase [Gammaproteobacteria bacterium]
MNQSELSSQEPGNGSGVLPQRPAAGVCLHFTSLPSVHGIGDIGDAARGFLQDLAAMGIRVWQVLPTGPTAYGDSPYQPLSAFAGNEMLIGLEPLVRAGGLAPEEVAELRTLPTGFVDYGRVIPLKQALLNRAAERFLEVAEPDLRGDYEAFVDEHGDAWLDDYALFRILKGLHAQRPWPEWASRYARRDPDALAEVRAEHADAFERIRVLQYLFDRQWRVLRERAAERGIRLFGDIPIYIALDSADAWANREMLQVDADGRPSHVAGVPPDYFSEDGQLWGNPLYDWDYHRRTGFNWWIQRMRHAARMFDFEAIEGALGSLPIVAEDLGVITEEVDALRLRHHIPGMVVLQFEMAEEGFDPASVEPFSVVYTGTHDNDTTTGWFQGSNDDTRTPAEIEAQRANALLLTGGSPETIATDLLRMALQCPARLAMAPLQDFLGLGSSARLNIPGTTRDNWRWRVLAEQLTGNFRESVLALVTAAGR